MKTQHHDELGEIRVLAEWWDENAQILLVEALDQSRKLYHQKQKENWRADRKPSKYYYCLWANSSVPVERTASVPCRTRSGRLQSIHSATKLFQQLVEATKSVTLAC
jgi:hypothetical protein